MIEIKGDERIEWMYPEIYEDNKSTLEIGMCHTRAADSIRIKYSSDRDGWIIEQASIFEWDSSDDVCDSDWQEVAFVQARGREKPSKETKMKILFRLLEAKSNIKEYDPDDFHFRFCLEEINTLVELLETTHNCERCVTS